MKHFGCLKDVVFDKSNETEISDFLIKEGIFEMIIEATGDPLTIKDGIMDFIFSPEHRIVEPKKALVDEFYSFIMNDVFKYTILENKLEFFSSFNNQIFGLEFLEQKKIALDHFNRIYNDNHINVITPFETKISETGIKHTYTYGKLQLLSYQLDGFKRNLVNKITLNNYLNGNKDFFTKENLLEKYDIEDEIQFEIWVQILVELNDRFKFEEDLYFTKIRNEKDRYNRYTHIFKSFESLQFTSRKIEKFKDNKKANIESLYQVLVNHDLIKDHKENFISFLKNEFDIVISKIISYNENENYTHDDRVKLFTQEWHNLASKKE